MSLRVSKHKSSNKINSVGEALGSTFSCESDPRELEWMKPIIMLFQAYAEYFSSNLIECLSVYENYENYIKDYLGKEPEHDINLAYNKVLC